MGGGIMSNAKYHPFTPATSLRSVPLFRTREVVSRPKVYLAGQIGKNCWRHDLVSGLRDALFSPCNESEDTPHEWPVLAKAILGKFDYVGPYFISCDHGCFHAEGGHGYAEEDYGGDGGHRIYFNESRETAHSLCLRSIHSADIVFAWIDSKYAYGTIVELGYAKALGKQIFIASPSYYKDMWFVYNLVSPDEWSIEYPGPLDAFRALLKVEEKKAEIAPKFESPLEEMFWREWQEKGGESTLPIVYQYVVPGKSYRIDFAEPQLKVGIELDGYAFHSDKEAFTKDRQRQRELEMLGWRFVRFSGAEIYKDVAGCFGQAVRYINTMKGK
jgi:very-short-patch-repair endonuclease